jgi:subtilase family serine protease
VRIALRSLVALVVLLPPGVAADVVVGLRGRDDERLRIMLARQNNPASADFQRWLAPGEFVTRYGASPRAIRRVSRWLHGAGCGVERLGRLLLRCHHARIGAPPPDVSPFVDGIVDVHDVALRAPPAGRPESIADGRFFFTPAEFDRTYGLDRASAGAVDGTGVTIGLLAFSQIDPDDLAAFRTQFGLSPAGIVQSGGSVRRDASYIEALLDASWAGAVAPGARLLLAVSDGSAVFRTLIGQNAADVISSSIDFCPPKGHVRAQVNRLLARMLREARAQGQTVLVASGDTGPATCPDGALGVLTSSPLATVVGGTMPAPVLDAGGVVTAYGSETAWNEGNGTFAGGGGPTSNPRPRYQRATGVRGSHRTVPDVAFPAALVYPIVVDGHTGIVGGTSAAAPAWAGVVARLVQGRGHRVGFLNPELYRLGRAQRRGGPAVFHDIVTGDTTTRAAAGYSAGPGYDLATGWGSVDGAALLDLFHARAPAGY